MKSLYAAAAAAALLLGAPGLARAETTLYGSVGYVNVDINDVSLGGIQGRIGGQINENFAVEGELAIGVSGDDVLGVDVDLSKEFGLFVVGSMPVSESASLFARVGWVEGQVDVGGVTVTDDGAAFGVGGQLFFTPNDGLRLEYTRYELDSSADTWALSYVRKF